MLFSLPIWLLRLVFLLSQHWPWLARRINAEIIDASARAGRRRPHPWSTVHPYISWTSLTDQTWSARHLPAAPLKNLPPPEKVSEFFQAADSGQTYCKKSTLLFPAFAQYLTDGFIRTVMPNESAGESPNLRRKNTSNHQIDLCPLYGRNQEQTRALRLLSQEPGRKGRLKSQIYNGEEYAPFLFDSEGREKTEFEKLDRILGLDQVATIEQKKTLFAFGGDRVNSAPQVAMINTLLLREHNRISGEIERAHPDWDDERNALIAIFIKIVVEDYINHIAPTPFSIKTDLSVAWTAPWNKPNWITVEFSLLYRWHSLIPASIMWNKKVYPVESTFFNRSTLGGRIGAGVHRHERAEGNPARRAQYRAGIAELRRSRFASVSYLRGRYLSQVLRIYGPQRAQGFRGFLH